MQSMKWFAGAVKAKESVEVTICLLLAGTELWMSLYARCIGKGRLDM